MVNQTVGFLRQRPDSLVFYQSVISFKIARLALSDTRFANNVRHSQPMAAGMLNRGRFATRAHGVIGDPLEMSMDKYSRIEKYIIASDVGSDRNGIGIEVYSGNDLLLEVFRDDVKKTRQLTFYKNELDLELVEQAIVLFKKEIPWEFQE